jgi:hypothetical protein
VLVAAPGETLPIASDDMVRITGSADVDSIVDELAKRPWRIDPRPNPRNDQRDRSLAS